ncbi:metal-sensing transcriptional repressor [Fusibacter sp. JL298sf-3]
MDTDKNTCVNCSRSTQRGDQLKKNLTNRCSRIEGQIRGIKGMIEKDAYCDDILNQIAAAQSALSSLSKSLLEHHMHTCMIHRVENGDYEIIDEMLKTIGKLMK